MSEEEAKRLGYAFFMLNVQVPYPMDKKRLKDFVERITEHLQQNKGWWVDYRHWMDTESHYLESFTKERIIREFLEEFFKTIDWNELGTNTMYLLKVFDKLQKKKKELEGDQ